MQHPVSKLALLALLCLISTRVHGARPIQPIFHLANFSHPLVIDNPYLSLPAGRHIVFYEVEGGECAVNDFVVTADTKSDFQGLYAGLSARAISDRVWLDEDCDGGRDLLLEDTRTTPATSGTSGRTPAPSSTTTPATWSAPARRAPGRQGKTAHSPGW